MNFNQTALVMGLVGALAAPAASATWYKFYTGDSPTAADFGVATSVASPCDLQSGNCSDSLLLFPTVGPGLTVSASNSLGLGLVSQSLQGLVPNLGGLGNLTGGGVPQSAGDIGLGESVTLTFASSVQVTEIIFHDPNGGVAWTEGATFNINDGEATALENVVPVNLVGSNFTFGGSQGSAAGYYIGAVKFASVPEPGTLTLTLLAAACCVAGGFARRKRAA